LVTGALSSKDQGGFALFDDDDDVYDDPSPHLSSGVDVSSGSSKQPSQYHAIASNMFRIADADTDTSGGYGGTHRSGPGSLLLHDVGAGAGKEGTYLPLQRCSTDDKPPLVGFRVSHPVTVATKQFPLPVVPPGFKEFHIFPSVKEVEQQSALLLTKKAHPTAESRVANIPSHTASSSEVLVGSGAMYDMLDARGKEQYNRALRRKAGIADDSDTCTSGVDASATIGKREMLITLQQQERQGELQQQKQMQQSAFSQGLGDALRNRFAPAVTEVPSGSDRGGGSTQQAEKAAHGLSSSFQPASSTSSTSSINSNSKTEKNNIRVLPNSGSRVSVAWQPARLLCKRMNVPVPAVADLNIGGRDSRDINAVVPKRESELYDAHVGKYMKGSTTTTSNNGTDSGGKGAGLISVVSRVTGDFELVSEEAFLAGERDRRKGTAHTPQSSSAVVSSSSMVKEENKSEIGHEPSGEQTSGHNQSEENPSLAPADATTPAVIPSLSLFQSIFCSDSESDSESDSDSESKNGDDDDAGNIEKEKEGMSVSESSSHLPSTNAPVPPPPQQQKKEDTATKKTEDTASDVLEPGKIVFRRPEKKSTDRRMPIGNRQKRRIEKPVLSFQGDNGEDDDEGDDESKEYSHSEKIKSTMKKKRVRRDTCSSSLDENDLVAPVEGLVATNPPLPAGLMTEGMDCNGTSAATSLIQKVQQSLRQEAGKRHLAGSDSDSDSEASSECTSDGYRSSGRDRGKHKSKKHRKHKHKHKHRKKESHKSSKKKRKKDSHH
jgi:hypothetical protein